MRKTVVGVVACAMAFAVAGPASAASPVPDCSVEQWGIRCSDTVLEGTAGRGHLIGVSATDGGRIDGRLAGTILGTLAGDIAGNLGGTYNSHVRELRGSLGGDTTQGTGDLHGSLGQRGDELGHGNLCGSLVPLEVALIRGGIVGSSDGRNLRLTIGGTLADQTHSLVIDTRSDPPAKSVDGRPCD